MSWETSCETVTGSIVALLDGELSAEERRAVEDHLATCVACARERADLEVTRRIVARHLSAAGDHVAHGTFAGLWARVESESVGGHRRDGATAGGPRSGPAAARARRRWMWAGLSAGAALAASFALVLLGPGGQGLRMAWLPGRDAQAPAVAPAAGTRVVVAQRPKVPAAPVVGGDSRSDDAEQEKRVARRVEPVPPRQGDETVAEPLAGAAVALNEIDPPRDLLERPDLFLNYRILRKLDELRNLDAVLADQGAEPQPTDGGAG